MSGFLKYYEKIRQAQQAAQPRGPGATPEFRFDKRETFFARIAGAVTSILIRTALWFFREFYPNPKFFRLVIVTRAADVREVLENQKAFQMPFGPEMTELGGVNSVLGMDDCPHDKMRGQIMAVLTPYLAEDQERLCADTREITRALIDNACGRIDVIGDLLTRSATESCARFFGLEVDDPVGFANWTMALSQILFADPFGKADVRQRAVYASSRLRAVMNRAIASAHKRIGAGKRPVTLVERFVAAQARFSDLSDARICATLVGLTTAFVPTSTLAGAKMLQLLMKRPDAWRQAREAACDGDRDRLQAILTEAGRLNPALYPGQWRYARTEAVIAGDTPHRRYVPKNSVLLVATGAALSDGRQFTLPRAFQPGRLQAPELMFGWGPHACLGKDLAKAQITEALMAVLALDDLRPAKGEAGRMRYVNAFPRQMDMEFTPRTGPALKGQSMVVVCAPLVTELEKQERVRGLVAALGNPAEGQFAQALKATGVIHFASLTVADLGEPDQPSPHLILEINADGSPETVLKAMAQSGRPWLGPIFAGAQGGDAFDLLDVFKRYNLEGHAKPWSMTHLNFNGVEEYSVADIQRQEGLADLAQRAIDYYVQPHLAAGRRAMSPLRFVRKLIAGHPDLDRYTDEVIVKLKADAVQFRAFMVQPSRRRLKIADWVEISIPEARRRTALSKHALPIWLALAAIAVVLGVGVFLAVGRWGLHIPSRIFTAFVTAILGEALGLGLVGWGVLALLRSKERTDPPDFQYPDFEYLQACTANENAPGYAQNHFMATPTLKKGLFRRLTLAAALWGIGTLIVYGFRPGFVLNMGTIHYAKWFRPPGSRRLVFFGNYDGSWESYLEDFITKAHLGQTAGWSNCEGFPPTEFLVGKGAEDGDRFKRWVRRQQIPTGFWYSRFPNLTTERVRNNALIHYGLVHARTDSAARAWLAYFGSQQRPESTLETDDIQSLVFQAFRGLTCAGYAFLKLPDCPQTCQDWLAALLRDKDPSTLKATPKDMMVTFGDAPGGDSLWRASAVAFSASGLRKLGLPSGEQGAGDGLATLPGAFRKGMSARARALGDDGEDAPEAWRWADVANGAAPGSDCVVMIYAKDQKRRDEMLEHHRQALGKDALVYWLKVESEHAEGLRHETFGFRDGMSQPVIRGTERFVRGVAPVDVVEPGEFILGYRANQGFFPPTPVVHADTDFDSELPTAEALSPKRVPTFEEGVQGSAFHDFGRNGSYLVLRQFEQHTEAFEDFTKDAARQLRDTYPDLERAIGRRVSADWVAAKLVGRWRDGTPLVNRPNHPESRRRGSKGDKRTAEDNSFTFGVDDPQGLRCPLGAHIRRANPRDSFDPSDKRGREITNRHRLLRRGRPYTEVGPDKETERGLIFACLCTDLERQFEFVQQTWINSRSFHGLTDEADPILRGDRVKQFTIPTHLGALRVDLSKRFVTVRGGGYYFLPSRSAIAYLEKRCRDMPR